MTIKVLIEDMTVETRSGISAKSGNPYEFHQQNGLFFGTDKWPLRFTFTIEDPSKPYPVGEYSLDIESFEVNRGQLSFARNLKMSRLNSSSSSVRAAS